MKTHTLPAHHSRGKKTGRRLVSSLNESHLSKIQDFTHWGGGIQDFTNAKEIF